jgi:hypothetical protein
MRHFICRINAGDQIEFVDESWVAFAAENGMPWMTLESVRGQSLWHYIPDETSRAFYKVLAEKVRKTGRTLGVPFRCDGPDRRRFMKMFMVNQPDGGLEFHSVLLDEQPRPKVELLDTNFPRSEEMLTMCAWCKKVKAGGWLEVEDAVRELWLFERSRLPQITHGVCPVCQESFELTLQTADSGPPVSIAQECESAQSVKGKN